MLADLLKEIYKEESQAPLKSFFETKTRGVFLGSELEDTKSAYERYYELHPFEKKEKAGEPIKKEVIDFIVSSLIVKEGAFPAHFQERIKKGFYEINKKSLTGRALIQKVRFEQEVDLTTKEEGSFACVYDCFDSIFFHRELHHRENPLSLSLTFLHESDHVLDHMQLRPFFENNKGYWNKKGYPIKGGRQKLCAEDEFFLTLAFEAEKQAQTYQIVSEKMSFFSFCCNLMKSIYKFYSDTFSECIYLLFFKKTGPYIPPSVSKDLIATIYKMHLWRHKFKRYLKDPRLLFQKEKRRRVCEQSALETMAGHIRFLTQPLRKNNIFTYLSTVCFYSGIAFFLGTLGKSAFSLLGVAFMGATYGLCITNGYYRQMRARWRFVYIERCLQNIRGCKAHVIGGKKKSRLIAKAFEERYNLFYTQKDISQIQTDFGDVERVLQSKKKAESFSPLVQADLFFLAFLYSKYRMTDQDKIVSPDWWVHEILSKSSCFLKGKGTLSEERAVLDTLHFRVSQTDVFDETIQKMSKEEILKFSPLRGVILEKRKKLMGFEKELQTPKMILVHKKSSRHKFLLKQKNKSRSRSR